VASRQSALSALAALLALVTMSPPGTGQTTPTKPLQGFSSAARLAPAITLRYEAALKFYKDCKYNQALRALDDVVNAEPDFAPAYHLRGDVYERLFAYDDAIEQYSRAIKLDPGNSLYLADRGIALMGPDRYEEARKDFIKALALDKNCSRALSGQGIDLRDHNQYKASIAREMRAMALEPSAWLPHTELAYCYRQIHRVNDAIQECDKAIALAPDLPFIHYCKAYSYRDAKDYDKMSEQFEIAIDRSPQVATYRADYAQALTNIEQNTKAYKLVSEALQMEPKNAEFHLLKARIADDLSKEQESADEATIAMGLKKDYAEAYRVRCRAYIYLDKAEESLADAKEAVRLAPKDIQALNLLTKVLLRAEKYDEAIENCNKTLKIDPTSDHAYSQRATCYFKLGKLERSLADYNKAIKLDDRESPVSYYYQQRATVLVLLHRYEEAEADEIKADQIVLKEKSEVKTLPVPLTPQQSFALACSAVLFTRNHDSNAILAGENITPAARADKIKTLASGWGVTNKASLVTAIHDLKEGSEHKQFAALGKLVSSLNQEEYDRFLASIKEDSEFCNKAKIARQYYDKLGEKGIIGWDLERALNICRFAYLAGLINDDEAWSLMYPTCKELQKHFNSFEEVGENYIIGRKFWGEAETKKTGLDFDVALAELTHFKSSPYRKQPWDVSFKDVPDDFLLPGSAASASLAVRAVGGRGHIIRPSDFAGPRAFNAEALKSLLGPGLTAKQKEAIEKILPVVMQQMSRGGLVSVKVGKKLSDEQALTLQKMMLGLRSRPAVAKRAMTAKNIGKVPQNIIGGPKIISCCRFNGGILMASRPRGQSAADRTIKLIQADLSAMKLVPITVKGMEKITDLVATADSAYIAGTQDDKQVVAELTTTGIKPLPAPPGEGAITLGTGNGTIIAIRGQSIYELENGQWQLLCRTNKDMSASAKLPPVLFHGRLYFVEVKERSELCWIDLNAPETVHHLADHLLPAERDCFNWQEIYDMRVCDGQLWVGLGSAKQAPALITIDLNNKYHIARYRNRNYIEAWTNHAPQNSGPLCLASGDRQDLFFSEGSALYHLKSGQVDAIMTLLRQDKNTLTNDWMPTSMLALNPTTLLVASNEGGTLLIKINENGGETLPFVEQTRPDTW